jgi:hypothetical protein
MNDIALAVTRAARSAISTIEFPNCSTPATPRRVAMAAWSRAWRRVRRWPASRNGRRSRWPANTSQVTPCCAPPSGRR